MPAPLVLTHVYHRAEGIAPPCRQPQNLLREVREPLFARSASTDAKTTEIIPAPTEGANHTSLTPGAHVSGYLSPTPCFSACVAS